MEIPQIAAYGKVTELNNTLSGLRTQRVLLDERYGEEHQKIKQNELDTREAQRMMKESLDLAIADMRARYARATQYVQSLAETKVEVEKETANSIAFRPSTKSWRRPPTRSAKPTPTSAIASPKPKLRRRCPTPTSRFSTQRIFLARRPTPELPR